MAPFKIDHVSKCPQSETCRQPSTFKIKLNVRVMVTTNNDLQDKIIIVKLGTVKHIGIDSKGNVMKMYIKHDDYTPGFRRFSTDSFVCEHGWFPMERAEANLRIRANKYSSPVLNSSPQKFLFILACGCTVHKAQGLTLEKVVSSFSLTE